MPAGKNPVGTTLNGGGIPYILGQLPSGLQDFLLLLIVFAFFSCGTSIQGAGSRLMFSYARDGALPASSWVASVHKRFKTPVNALLAGAVVTALFVLLEFISPTHDVKIGFITYPANTNVLVSLISFGVSGIYLSFLLTVIGVIVARVRGWIPAGKFRLGRWAWPVTVLAGAYLLAMFVNVVAPTGLSSPRSYFNLDWITLLVMFVVFVVGVIFFLAAHGGRALSTHMRDDAPAASSAATEASREP
jgi:amino acid transporter